MKLFFLIISVPIFFSACKTYAPLPSDARAHNDTKKAYDRLKTLSQKGILIGYEDALAYGIDWKIEDGKCDMFRTCGEYPAIYGWDIGDIHKTDNLDTVSFARMINWIKEVHSQGGINTISWHMDNPVTGASSWDRSNIAKEILPGGEHHDKLLTKLDRAALILKNCRIGNIAIPIIFRPFHEHNGDWFWWGKGNTSPEDYVALYRFVSDYLRDYHNLHNLIFVFSPDRSRMAKADDRSEYLYAYPGDDYVDLLGIDNYADVRTTEVDSINETSISNFVSSLELIVDLAEEKGKIAALTETGFEGIKDEKWFTERILDPIAASEKAQKISYILMWRNANRKHHYMAYPGHSSSDNFVQFIQDPITLTLKDIGRN